MSTSWLVVTLLLVLAFCHTESSSRLQLTRILKKYEDVALGSIKRLTKVVAFKLNTTVVQVDRILQSPYQRIQDTSNWVRSELPPKIHQLHVDIEKVRQEAERYKLDLTFCLSTTILLNSDLLVNVIIQEFTQCSLEELHSLNPIAHMIYEKLGQIEDLPYHMLQDYNTCLGMPNAQCLEEVRKVSERHALAVPREVAQLLGELQAGVDKVYDNIKFCQDEVIAKKMTRIQSIAESVEKCIRSDMHD